MHTLNTGEIVTWLSDFLGRRIKGIGHKPTSQQGEDIVPEGAPRKVSNALPSAFLVSVPSAFSGMWDAKTWWHAELRGARERWPNVQRTITSFIEVLL